MGARGGQWPHLEYGNLDDCQYRCRRYIGRQQLTVIGSR